MLCIAIFTVNLHIYNTTVNVHHVNYIRFLYIDSFVVLNIFLNLKSMF